jgi:hypothetical protein
MSGGQGTRVDARRKSGGKVRSHAARLSSPKSELGNELVLFTSLRHTFEHDSIRLVTVAELFAVDAAEFFAKRDGGGEAVGDGVGVGEGIDVDALDRRDPDRADAGDVAPLAGTHVAVLPQADRLRFGAAADGVEEFLFEE